jgi:hypothetical protein
MSYSHANVHGNCQPNVHRNPDANVDAYSVPRDLPDRHADANTDGNLSSGCNRDTDAGWASLALREPCDANGVRDFPVFL